MVGTIRDDHPECITEITDGWVDFDKQAKTKQVSKATGKERGEKRASIVSQNWEP